MICAPSSSAKHRSSSACGSALTPSQQHALVAHVADAGVEHRPGRLGHQRGHRVGVVDVGVDRERRRRARGPWPATRVHALDDVVLQPVLGQAHQRLGGQPDVADVLDLEQPGEERPRAAATACWPRRRRRRPRRAPTACGAGSRACRRAGRRACARTSACRRPGVELPTRSMRVQWPQYCGQVGSSSASTLVG